MSVSFSSGPSTGLLSGDVPSSIQIPLSTAAETGARATFTQLMWALSYPGRRFNLPGQIAASSSVATFNCCVAIANTLLDLETTFFTPDVQLGNVLARTGARHLEAAHAAYHFYPNTVTLPQVSELLQHARAASVGTLLYPDQAATLIVACKLGVGVTMRLRGPGIVGENALVVGGLSPAFWQMRAERVIYPLGWDLFLVDGDQVVGLPRTTVIEVDDKVGSVEGGV